MQTKNLYLTACKVTGTIMSNKFKRIKTEHEVNHG